MNKIRVSSWSELQEQLFAGAWQADIRRFRSTCAFRGVPDAAYSLETSLMLLGGDYASMERHLLRNFRKYASAHSVDVDSEWNWLSLAKHHGLPCRLLDWSFSPFVAMHFATANIYNYGLDGAIWMVDYRQVHTALPETLNSLLAQEGSDVFTIEMLGEAASSLEAFDSLASDDFAVFFEPPSLDERIVNQYALFSLLSSPTARLEDWLSGRPSSFRKIILPAGLKWELRDKLDQANVTERVLFPGLDGLSAWLTRQYTPRTE